MKVSTIGVGPAVLLAVACGGYIDVGSNVGQGGMAGQGGMPNQGNSLSLGRGGNPRASGSLEVGSTAAGGNTGATSCDAMGGRTVEISAQGGRAPRDLPLDPPLAQQCSEPIHEVWEGQRKDPFFNPLDTWRLTLTGRDPNGHVCGTVTLLGAPPPAPPTSPDQIYPVGFNPEADLSLPPTPGFEYSIVDGGEQLDELRVQVFTNELWNSWCAMITPELGLAGYDCFGGTTTELYDDCCLILDQTTGQSHSISAARCTLCPRVCNCDATGCAAWRTDSVVLELTHDGSTTMHGTISTTERMNNDNPILFERVE